jgi:hypothetical protein
MLIFKNITGEKVNSRHLASFEMNNDKNNEGNQLVAVAITKRKMVLDHQGTLVKWLYPSS